MQLDSLQYSRWVFTVSPAELKRPALSGAARRQLAIEVLPPDRMCLQNSHSLLMLVKREYSSEPSEHARPSG